jgi:hypothetical protein
VLTLVVFGILGPFTRIARRRRTQSQRCARAVARVGRESSHETAGHAATYLRLAAHVDHGRVI